MTSAPASSPPQVVILCGGRGTRMRVLDRGEQRPKGMLEIGGQPIIWHIMKTFAHHGYRHFVLCLGHGGHLYRDYFVSYARRHRDFSLSLATGEVALLGGDSVEDWQIDFIDTGEGSGTAERLLRAAPHVTTDPFFVAYVDDLADIDLTALLAFHREQGRVATLTGLRPQAPFGVLESDGDRVVSFQEKPRLPQWANGGFYVFSRAVRSYLERGRDLEHEPLAALAADGELSVFRHAGFWMPMNTPKELIAMNQLWYGEERPPWKVWR